MLCDHGKTKQFLQNIAHIPALTSGYGCKRENCEVHLEISRHLLEGRMILDWVFNVNPISALLWPKTAFQAGVFHL